MMKKLIGGASVAILTLAGAAAAQTTTGTTTPTTTPGVPATGVGGDAMFTGILLAASLLVAFAGALYLYMRNRTHVTDR